MHGTSTWPLDLCTVDMLSDLPFATFLLVCIHTQLITYVTRVNFHKIYCMHATWFPDYTHASKLHQSP